MRISIFIHSLILIPIFEMLNSLSMLHKLYEVA
jgi:hypothetical protein